MAKKKEKLTEKKVIRLNEKGNELERFVEKGRPGEIIWGVLDAILLNWHKEQAPTQI